MNKTSIEWVKNPDGSPGYSFNPISGCLNHVNGVCKGGNFPCYAYRLAHGRLKQMYLTNHQWTPVPMPHSVPALFDPFYPRFWQDRLADMVWQQETKPKGIFVCDMGELFGDWLPEQWQKQVFAAIRVNSQHRFYLLTKQPQNLIKFSPYPDNCYVGVTATSHRMLEDALYNFVGIEARVKFISFEPLLEPMNLIKDFPYEWDQLNWVIIGAQTRPTVYPRIEWVQELLVAAHNAGDMPVFIKDNLRPLIEREWPGWKLRQEMPE